MTDFLTEADIIAAIAGAESAGFNQDFYKASITTVSGFDYSGWMAGGSPIAGNAPTTWVSPLHNNVGAINWRMVNSEATKTMRLLAATIRPSVANQPYIIQDRLGHMAGLSGTSTSAQSVNGTIASAAAQGRCLSTGRDVDWWLEWYTTTGSTAVNATVNVTYEDGTTADIVVALPASVPAYRRHRIVPGGVKGIKGVNTVTLSATTGTAGNFGVTATQRICGFSVPAANSDWIADWALTKMSKVGQSACLQFATYAVGTAFGTLTGNMVVGAA